MVMHRASGAATTSKRPCVLAPEQEFESSRLLALCHSFSPKVESVNVARDDVTVSELYRVHLKILPFRRELDARFRGHDGSKVDSSSFPRKRESRALQRTQAGIQTDPLPFELSPSERSKIGVA